MAKKTLQLQVESEDLTVPQDRIEWFLAKAAGLVGTMPEGQFSRLERYLAIIAAGGGGGGAPIDSPTFTGVPKAPTAAKGTNTTQIATTQFVQTAIGDKQDTLGYTTAEVNRLLGLVDSADDVAGAGVAPGGFGIGTNLYYTAIIASQGETYAEYCAKVDAVINSMPINTMKIVGAYPPDILGRVSNPTAFLRNYDKTYASLSCINPSDTSYGGWRMVKLNGVWQPFEWTDPPMNQGVEYRTTERFWGKPVYAICKNFDTTTRGYVSIPHGVPNVDVIVSSKLYLMFASNNRPQAAPYIAETSSLSAGYNVFLVECNSNNFKFQIGANIPDSTKFWGEIKYTKTTD